MRPSVKKIISVTASAEPVMLRFSGVSRKTITLRLSSGLFAAAEDSSGANLTVEVGTALQASAAACSATTGSLPAGINAAPWLLTKNLMLAESVRLIGAPVEVNWGPYP